MPLSHFEPRSSNEGKRTRYVYYPAKQGEMVKLSISHRDGGQNYFSSKVEKRGVEISISMVEVSDRGNGVTMESSTPMSDDNARLLIAEVPRYSAKKITAIVEAFDDKAPEICTKWKDDRAAAIALLQETAQAAARLAA